MGLIHDFVSESTLAIPGDLLQISERNHN